MRTFFFVVLIAAGLGATMRAGQEHAPSGGPITLEQVVNKMTIAESGLKARMVTFKPIVEVYSQNIEPHPTLGSMPAKDEYVLGQFEYNPTTGPTLKRLTPERSTGNWLSRPFSMQLQPSGFASMALPDWRLVSKNLYDFTFLRREFLGEVRCVVLDVKPKNPNEGFTGRLWVEDRDFNIVRFNGITRTSPASTMTGKRFFFNVDSWRMNVKPGLWVPAYVYSELTSEDPREEPRIKAQVRLWGYDLKTVRPMQEMATIVIDEPSVNDSSARPQQLSPTQSQRFWEQQAEDNVTERLSKTGLMAPAGAVDKVLETVIRNLEITNNLNIEPPVRARVLLTSPLESMTVGHTIVLSRGLIDVLPDESSLAMMLAHELAHIALGHRVIDTKYAFADKLVMPDDELLAAVTYRHDPKEEAAADAEVIKYLKASPYADKLAEAGLFLKMISENSRKLRNLIQPHVASHVGDDGQITQLNELVQKAPSLSPERLDQIAALSLGSRLTVNPWTGVVELLRNPTTPLASAREKASMSVTPLVPYLRYVDASATAEVKN